MVANQVGIVPSLVQYQQDSMPLKIENLPGCSPDLLVGAHSNRSQGAFFGSSTPGSEVW